MSSKGRSSDSPELSSIFSESSSSNEGEFDDRYGNNAYPNEDDVIINDEMASKPKAMGGTRGAFDQFAGPTACALSIESHSSGLSINTDLIGDKSGFNGDVIQDEAPKHNVLEFAIGKEDVLKSLHSSVFAPKRPPCLLPCHFRITKSLESILRSIRNLFEEECTEVDFEFVSHECCFNGVYIRGSRYTDFKLRVYEDSFSSAKQDDTTPSFIVEVQRLQKESDGYVFKQVFELLKRVVSSGDSSPVSTTDLPDIHSSSISGGMFDISSGELSTCSQPTDEEIALSIRQVLSMAQEHNENSQLEAVRILCDLSDEPAIWHQMSEAGVVEALSVMIKNQDRLLVRQNSVIALAQLSGHVDCVLKIISSGALPTLMKIASNGMYQTACLRREAARVIANVADMRAKETMAYMTSEVNTEFPMDAWEKHIGTLTDPRVKERCERALSKMKSA